jgi:hypothetical protein
VNEETGELRKRGFPTLESALKRCLIEHAALIDPFPEYRDREDHHHCLDGDFDGH